jgi:hypothetical protein
LLSLRLRIFLLNLATSSKSPAHSSTGTRSTLARLPLFVSVGFHVLFHSSHEVLFTFPSRYFFTIGHLGVFSLTRWSSLIHTGFHVSHATREKQTLVDVFWLRDFHRLWCRIQLLRLNEYQTRGLTAFRGTPQKADCFPTTPIEINWFRLIPFRSPLLRESRLLSFPLATKMFQFTKFSLSDLWIQSGVQEVDLFGNLRITAFFQLPEAFRRFHALHRL